MQIRLRAAAKKALSTHARTHGVKAIAGLMAVGMCTSATGAGGPKNVAVAATARVRQWFQVGEASWYGRARQGHLTASGERFDMNGFTCAHRTLPFGSWLRVTNLKNRRSVLVRVTDRGAFSPARVIDLSKAAAAAVGIDGIGQVRLEALNPSDPEVVARMLAGVVAPLASKLSEPPATLAP